MQATSALNETKYGSMLNIPAPEVFGTDYSSNFREAYVDTSGQYNKYVIDMRQTKEMENCALNMLFQMREYLEDDNPDIHLINCNRKLMKILQITSFDQIFYISEK